MSKKTDERTTPDKLFLPLHEEFNFEVDLAATHENRKLSIYYTKEDSAFKYKWDKRNFLNPPYSELVKWLRYAVTQSGLTVIILPCDTSTGWFHDYLWDDKLHQPRENIELRFPRGRYCFGKYITSPQFATIIAIVNKK